MKPDIGTTPNKNHLRDLFALITNDSTLLKCKIKYIKYLALTNKNADEWNELDRNLLSWLKREISDDPNEWDNFDPLQLEDFAETLLLMDERESLHHLIHYLEERFKRNSMIFYEERPRAYRKLMILECLAGLEPMAFDDAFALYSEFPVRSTVREHGYQELASAAADCYHLSPLIQPRIKKVVECIKRAGNENDRKSTAGIVFRKLCMRSETACTPSIESLRVAEQYFLPLIAGDSLEKIFCLAQAAISLYLLSDRYPETREELKKESDHYLKKLIQSVRPHSDEVLEIVRDMHLLRAYAQIGYDDRVSDLSETFYNRANESFNTFNNLMLKFKTFQSEHGNLPHDFADMKYEAEMMSSQYSKIFVHGLLHSGRFARTERSRKNLLNKLEKLVSMEFPVNDKLDALLGISNAYSFLGNRDRSLIFMQRAVDYSRRIPPRERKEILISDLTETASENYMYTGDPIFISSFMDDLNSNDIKDKHAEEGARFFLDNLSAIAYSRRWEIAFG
ncbi:MAG: hypothetical protein ACYCSO_03295 [Cuniculiplasma sp.]